jgi:hypothetical protein
MVTMASNSPDNPFNENGVGRKGTVYPDTFISRLVGSRCDDVNFFPAEVSPVTRMRVEVRHPDTRCFSCSM